MDRDAWIALRASKKTGGYPERFSPGYEDEFFGAVTAAVPVKNRKIAEKVINWHQLGLLGDNGPWFQGKTYHRADEFHTYPEDVKGTHLVLCQRGTQNEHQEWHPHPDLVMGLNLKREGDAWLAVDEGYAPIIRLFRNPDGAPDLLEIRSEHLKDFLAAINACLCVSTYRSREVIVAEKPDLPWSGDPTVDEVDGHKWQGSITAINEHGIRFGDEIAILHVSRKNFDMGQDVPEVGIEDDFDTESSTKQVGGTKLFRVWGELWKVEFIEPGLHSPRVRHDDVSSQVFFYVDGAANRKSADELGRMGRWLWFKPDVINKALEFRGSSLTWYTAQTGGIDFGAGGNIHFGVNDLGLVNVYAKDVGYSHIWQQQIWAGFNIAPDGGVSRELLMSQAQGIPASTQAPEAFLKKSIEMLNQNSIARFGFEIIRPHADQDRLFRSIHRFRAIDELGFYSLAKDIARITADSINSRGLQTIVPVPKDQKRGSLKSLESVLGTVIDSRDAACIMAPLFGAYDLRLADAHLPSTDIEDAFERVNAERTTPWIQQGTRLLHAVVCSLTQIGLAFAPVAQRSPGRGA
jgi:hypothetical protein